MIAFLNSGSTAVREAIASFPKPTASRRRALARMSSGARGMSSPRGFGSLSSTDTFSVTRPMKLDLAEKLTSHRPSSSRCSIDFRVMKISSLIRVRSLACSLAESFGNCTLPRPAKGRPVGVSA